MYKYKNEYKGKISFLSHYKETRLVIHQWPHHEHNTVQVPVTNTQVQDCQGPPTRPDIEGSAHLCTALLLQNTRLKTHHDACPSYG